MRLLPADTRSVTVPEGEPLPNVPPPVRPPIPDPVIQIRDGLGVAGAPGAPVVNIPGLSSGANPPDTVGDIGKNHYIQMVNATNFQIWDKAGNALTGPISLGSLWPVGTTCRGNSGDPIVVYDHLGDRWILSQFNGGATMCFAVSQTPDPTAGTWFLYDFNTGVFPDYPKLGVWGNTLNMTSYEGSTLGIYVFRIRSMVEGQPATMVKRTIPSLGAVGIRETRILPVDLDGPKADNDTPAFFVRTVDDQQDPAFPQDRIEIYQFRVNWQTSVFNFSLLQTLIPAPFQAMVCNRAGGGVRDCIPEPQTTSTVDSLSTRPMMQLKFRNFGTHYSMVTNQTIDVRASMPVPAALEVGGVRWYELRRAAGGGAWSIFQQGTFAPQPGGITAENELIHRYMGSIAVDKMGNMALGYSANNDDDANPIFPGIRYTGRESTDPLGTMGAEQTILNGINSQTGGLGRRWGDYSAMSVDPVDNCTFWYTNHVAGAGGTGIRPTRIASFKFANCN